MLFRVPGSFDTMYLPKMARYMGPCKEMRLTAAIPSTAPLVGIGVGTKAKVSFERQ